MSGLPGGSMMGTNGVIHNYNPNCQFSLLNEMPSMLNLQPSQLKTRNKDSASVGFEKYLPLNTMPSKLQIDDATVITDTPMRMTKTSRKNTGGGYLPVNGSFLQLDKKGDKLVDLSNSLVREPQSLITGLKQHKDIYSICARDEPWRIASKMTSTPIKNGVATNDTSNRDYENSSKDISLRIF
jgi:hypothetical protein